MRERGKEGRKERESIRRENKRVAIFKLSFDKNADIKDFLTG